MHIDHLLQVKPIFGLYRSNGAVKWLNNPPRLGTIFKDSGFLSDCDLVDETHSLVLPKQKSTKSDQISIIFHFITSLIGFVL